MIKTLNDALEQRGYDTLTPVQQAVTDPDLTMSDLLVSAQTGSGKTVGFGLALGPTLLAEAEQFDTAAAPLALVIAPTRELALQVKRELSWLYGLAGAHLASCVGGMDMRDERRALARGAHIVVATPGRLRDHIMRGSIDLSSLRAVVLDEADEMLDLGFREDLEFILEAAPESRRTLMFSATVPAGIAKLAKNFQRDAVRVTTLAEKSQHSDIEYQAMSVAPRDAENAIINVLRYYEAPNALVFCNTRAMVNRMTTRLSNRGFSVVSLSGELSQSERTHALQAMRDGRARVCVATDVAARGIDLPNLDLVIHAELPSNHETLLHRSGRTGRAGRKGVSALIVPPKVRKKTERILKSAKVTAQWGEAPSADAVRGRDQERMMADPAWSEPVSDAEASSVAMLMDAFSAEQIAVAYLRLHAARQSAPEELGTSGMDGPPKPREPFGPSVWFSVAGGHAAEAEPRRLLPTICRFGDLTKDDIGAIRIQQTLSYFELRAEAATGFVKSLGSKMELEPGAPVTQLDKPPVITPHRRGTDAPKPRKPRDHDAGAAKPRPCKPEAAPAATSSQPIDWNDAPDVKPKKPKGKPAVGKSGGKPRHKARAPERPDGVVEPFRKKKPGAPASRPGQPKRKGMAPPVGKPNSKKNRARAKAAAEAAGKGGNARPKRPKP